MLNNEDADEESNDGVDGQYGDYNQNDWYEQNMNSMGNASWQDSDQIYNIA